jgi:hypothetical protein
MSVTIAKNVLDVVRWIRDNPHYEGWWDGTPATATRFTLRGDLASLVIPRELHDSEAIESDPEREGFMYRPSSKGISMLASSPETNGSE